MNGRIIACALPALLAMALLLVPATAHAKTSSSSKSTKITITATGDCAFFNELSGKSVFNDRFNEYGPDYFLKNLRPIFAGDDVTIMNYEGTLTEATSRKIKTYNFKGPAKYVNIIKNSSVEIANLANNHTLDFKLKGLNDTKRTLRQNGIAYCYKTTIAYKTVKGVKMAFLGFNNAEIGKVTKKQIKTGIKKAKKKGAKIIVVSMHWGIERRYMPSKRQKELGRYAIDCGASVVLGNHPHVLQGIEKYKGRCIVYSMGNLCWGGNANWYDKDTMLFQQTFTVKKGKLQKGIVAKVIPCRLSGDQYANNSQPVVLADRDKKQVMSKIRTLCKATGTTIKLNGAVK